MSCTSIPPIVSIHSNLLGKHVLLTQKHRIDNPEEWVEAGENLWFNPKSRQYASVAIEGYKQAEDFRSYVNQKIQFNKEVYEKIQHHTTNGWK